MQAEDNGVEENVEDLVESSGKEEIDCGADDQQAEVVEDKQENLGDKENKSPVEEIDYKSKYYYLAAEMDNMRKRFEKEKCNLIKYGNEKILSSLIEVVDDFERTVDALSNETDERMKNVVSGIKMVQERFLSVLAQNGLTQIEALGKIFDPNFHEAMSQQAVEGKQEHEVVNEYQKGYVLNGRLLRASKVVIAKNN